MPNVMASSLPNIPATARIVAPRAFPADQATGNLSHASDGRNPTRVDSCHKYWVLMVMRVGTWPDLWFFVGRGRFREPRAIVAA